MKDQGSGIRARDEGAFGNRAGEVVGWRSGFLNEVSMDGREKEKLRSILAELHAHLEQLETVDPEVQEMLRGALADMQHAAGPASGQVASPSTEGSQIHQGTVAQRLAEAARHFEESHPALAGTLGSAIDALSRMGI
jgi:hypothetical protein